MELLARCWPWVCSFWFLVALGCWLLLSTARSAPIFRCTLPTTDGISTGDSCVALPSAPLVDLDSLFVHARSPGGNDHITIRHDVHQFAGFDYAAPAGAINAGDTVWVVLQDTHGNQSCPSNKIVWPVTVSVVGPGPPAPKDDLYDIAGRKIDTSHAATPGVYFARPRGSLGARKVVVIR